MGPRVSIVMPTLGRDLSRLRRAVASVVAQTFANWQLVVTPDSEAAADLCNLLDLRDPRIVTLPLDPAADRLGVSHARNRAVTSSSGGILAYLDDDNYWHPEMLKVCAQRDRTRWFLSSLCASIAYNLLGSTRSLGQL